MISPDTRIGPAPRTDEWLAARRNAEDPKFGASDAAAICGVSEYNTALGVYTEFVEPQPKVATKSMRRGQIYEEAIQIDWSVENERSIVTQIPMLFHPSAPLFATLDAQTYDTPLLPIVLYWNDITDAERAVLGNPLESKFSMSPTIAQQLGEDESDWVPPDWYLQVQQQMDIVKEQEAIVVVLIYGKLRTYNVPRRQTVIDRIHEQADNMRQRILHRLPPPADFEHSTTKGLIDRLAMGVEGGEVEATPEMTALWSEARTHAERRLEHEKAEKKLKTMFKAAMVEQSVDCAVMPDGRRVVLQTIDVAEKVVKGYSYTKLWERKN